MNARWRVTHNRKSPRFCRGGGGGVFSERKGASSHVTFRSSVFTTNVTSQLLLRRKANACSFFRWQIKEQDATYLKVFIIAIKHLRTKSVNIPGGQIKCHSKIIKRDTVENIPGSMG